MPTLPTDILSLLNLWEPALRKVRAAKLEAERGNYYTPLRVAYEAACVERDELSAAIEGAL